MYTVDISACVYTCADRQTDRQTDRQIPPSKAKKILSDTFGVPECKITSHRINKNPKNETRRKDCRENHKNHEVCVY